MKLKLEHLHKKFSNKLVLEDLNLSIENKSIIGVIGPSGGGKSTLLRMIAGFESISSGNIFINDIDVKNDKTKLHKNCGFVFQSDNLFLHLTVLRNITIVLEKVHKIPVEQAREKALKLLKQFGLAEHVYKKPHQLSGGQSQRVSIIRALAIEPSVLLFDEPTSSLDPVLSYDVLETILELGKKEKDFIIVTHEIGFVKEVADYIIYINQGKIVEHGDISILENPASDDLKLFLSKVLSWSN